jgi:hypothetical protein
VCASVHKPPCVFWDAAWGERSPHVSQIRVGKDNLSRADAQAAKAEAAKGKAKRKEPAETEEAGPSS